MGMLPAMGMFAAFPRNCGRGSMPADPHGRKPAYLRGRTPSDGYPDRPVSRYRRPDTEPASGRSGTGRPSPGTRLRAADGSIRPGSVTESHLRRQERATDPDDAYHT